MCLRTLTKESLAVIGARPGELTSLVINLGAHAQRVTVKLIRKCVSLSVYNPVCLLPCSLPPDTRRPTFSLLFLLSGMCPLWFTSLQRGTTVQLVTHQYVRQKSPSIGFKQLLAIIWPQYTRWIKLMRENLRITSQNFALKVFVLSSLSHAHTHVHTQRVYKYT